MREISRISLTVLMLLAATAAIASPRFELLSRSLLQGPVRSAVICDQGVVIGSGGALYVIPEGTEPESGILVQLDGEPLSLAAREGIIYAAVDKLGLVTLDITDPTSPALGIAYESKSVHSLALRDRFILVSDNMKGLLLFDISGNSNPKLIDVKEEVIKGRRLWSGGERIVATMWRTAEILEIGGGNGIETTVSVEAGRPVAKGYANDSVLYILTKQGEVLRFDISDPSSPTPLPPLAKRGVKDIHIAGGEGMMLLGNGTITSFGKCGRGDGAADPRYSLMIKDGLKLRSGFQGSYLVAAEGYLATYDPLGKFELFGLEGDHATPLGNFETSGFAIDLTARDGYVYLANGKEGLRTGRISDDGTIEWIGRIQTTEARDAAIDGNILVLGDGTGGTRFFSLDDPAAPKQIGHIDSHYYICSVVAKNSIAYLGGGLQGAEIVDFSNPESPRLVWRHKFSEVRGLDSDGEYLYLCDGFEGLRVFTLSRRSPVQIAQVNTPGWACDAFITGNILCLADGGDGIMTLDISDPSSPVVLGTVSVGSIAREIHVWDKTLFVASNKAGITAVDISDPAEPVITGRHQSVDDGRGVFVDGRFVFLASGSGGLYIFRYGR
jgi:hypothetical protein